MKERRLYWPDFDNPNKTLDEDQRVSPYRLLLMERMQRKRELYNLKVKDDARRMPDEYEFEQRPWRVKCG